MRTQIIQVLVVSFLLAACVAIGDIHRYTKSDAIMPVLASTQHWTPFYWGQNRFGMLFPLLALPIRSPFLNLCFQSMSSFFVLFAGIFLASRWLFPTRFWPAIGALTLALVLGLYQESLLLGYSYNPQAPSIGLCIAGVLLIFLRSSLPAWSQYLSLRNLTGAALIFCSIWLNPTVVISIVPITIIVGIWTTEADKRNLYPSPDTATGLPEKLWPTGFPRWRLLLFRLSILGVSLVIVLLWMCSYSNQTYNFSSCHY